MGGNAVDRDQLPGTFFGPTTLVELLRHRMQCQPDDTAYTYLVDGETQEVRISYRELDRQARAIGAWLQTHGLAGQRALLLYPAGIEFIAAFFGCLYAGVIAVPVYPPRRNRSMMRIQAVSDDAQAQVALTTDQVLKRVEPLIDETPHLKNLAWLPTCQMEAGIEDRWQMPEITGDTLAFLQYTSGSTGTPKGVMLNHANLIHNSALIAYVFEHTRSGIGVFWLPSYHDMGLIGGILQPLYVGRPNILMSPMSFLQKPYRWLAAISRYGGSTSGGPNFAYELCIRKVTPEQRKNLDLSTWTVAFNGAEPVRPETIEAFCETFGPCGFRREAFYPCYGLAEATLIVSGGYAKKSPIIRSFEAGALTNHQVVDADPDDEGVQLLVGCGQAMRDQKIVIADPQTLTPCGADEIGEIWVKGPSVAQGYWQQPIASATTFQAYLKDCGEGPFLRTGDLGFLRDGELFVTGRLKDLIIIRGQNHYPQDIELTVAHSNPRLRSDAGAAFTLEVEGRQQLVVVQEIERRKQGNLDQVFNAIRREVAAEHDLALDAIVLIKAGSIPKTSSGKIQRHACRTAFLAGTLEVVGQWQAVSNEGKAAAELAKIEIRFPGSRKPAEAPAATMPGSVGSLRSGRLTPPPPTGHASSDADSAKRREHLVNLVMEQVRLVAKDRADHLTLETRIADIGLDSLERMEILAALEDRFGGHFPEQVLPKLENCRQVVDAVQQYLGAEPRPRGRGAGSAIPAETYVFSRFPEYQRLRQNLEAVANAGLENPYFRLQRAVTNDQALVDDRVVLNFCSHNYLGASGDPAVSRAARDAIDRYGTSNSSSRSFGEKDLHRQLEQELAEFLRTPAALTFASGHATNETTIGNLVGTGDLILHDALAHNSILQGAMLSGARRRPFPHNDYQAVDFLLEQYRREYRRVLVVIEGVYSMDGDIPELPRFIEVKNRHQALLMVDEAHSLGTLGSHGQGIGEYYQVDRADVDIWMGTLSKACGSCGGYIAGCRELIEYLKYTAPGFVHGVAMAPPAAAAALAALRLIQTEPERVIRLQRRANLLLTLARQRGFNTGASSDSPIVPIILGDSAVCLQLAKAMLARGVNVMPTIHPNVEENAARLRFFVTASHTEQQIRHALDVLAEEIEQAQPGVSDYAADRA